MDLEAMWQDAMTRLKSLELDMTHMMSHLRGPYRHEPLPPTPDTPEVEPDAGSAPPAPSDPSADDPAASAPPDPPTSGSTPDDNDDATDPTPPASAGDTGDTGATTPDDGGAQTDDTDGDALEKHKGAPKVHPYRQDLPPGFTDRAEDPV